MANTKTKQAFLVHYDYEETFKELSTAGKASLIMAMFEYERTQKVTKDLKKDVKMAFISIRNSLDREREKWEDTVQKRSDAGQKGNSTRWNNPLSQSIANGRKTSQCDKENRKSSQAVANIAVSVNDSESVSVSDNVSVSEREGDTPAPAKFIPPTLQEIQDYAKENNLVLDTERFFLHYDNCRWRLSGGRGSLMKSWKSSLKLWIKREPQFAPKNQESASDRVIREYEARQKKESEGKI